MISDSLVTFTTVRKSPAAVAAAIGAGAAPFLVAEAGGQVLGLATCGPFRSGPGYAFCVEHSVHLDPQARRRGIGTMLMEHLQQAAAVAGKRVMVAAISGANPGAVAFHAALGFTEVGRMPAVGFKAGQWLDLVLMQKRLAAMQRRT